uniref:Uncharacterized protein n=1 Tax=Setaria digitata TaxID=48799 RepID=A0A915PT35_9BILA
MEQALSIFERLSLKMGDSRIAKAKVGSSAISKKPSRIICWLCQKTEQPSTASGSTGSLSLNRARHRYKPYFPPLISKKVDTPKRYSAVEKFRSIQLKGDVEELRFTLAEVPATMESCSVEASRYSPWDLADEGVDGEVAELAEYFDQFVNICLKMSALAESMYA